LLLLQQLLLLEGKHCLSIADCWLCCNELGQC
jgi:hypothetical protein